MTSGTSWLARLVSTSSGCVCFPAWTRKSRPAGVLVRATHDNHFLPVPSPAYRRIAYLKLFKSRIGGIPLIAHHVQAQRFGSSVIEQECQVVESNNGSQNPVHFFQDAVRICARGRRSAQIHKRLIEMRGFEIPMHFVSIVQVRWYSFRFLILSLAGHFGNCRRRLPSFGTNCRGNSQNGGFWTGTAVARGWVL